MRVYFWKYPTWIYAAHSTTCGPQYQSCKPSACEKFSIWQDFGTAPQPPPPSSLPQVFWLGCLCRISLRAANRQNHCVAVSIWVSGRSTHMFFMFLKNACILIPIAISSKVFVLRIVHTRIVAGQCHRVASLLCACVLHKITKNHIGVCACE